MLVILKRELQLHMLRHPRSQSAPNDALLDTGLGARATTDADGRYEMRLPPGEHRVHWFGSIEEARGAEPAEGHQLELSADEVREDVDFVLSRKRRIALTVLGPDGTPATGVEVLWDGRGQRVPQPGSEPLLTDAKGQVELLFGPTVEPWGNDVIAAYARDTERGLAGVALIQGETQDKAEITLAEGAWAVATAQTRDGEPIADVPLRLRYMAENQMRELLLQPVTDEGGHVRIGPLPPAFELGIGPSWEYDRRTLQPRGQSMPSETFEPGETREFGPYVMVPDGFTIRGIVIDEDGEPAEGVLVICGDTLSYERAEDTTDAEGRFELPEIAVSEEMVTVIAAMPDGSAAWAEPADPQVAYEPTIQLGKPGTVVATIVGADGRPVPDVGVRISGENVRVPSPQSLPGELKTYGEDLRTDAEGQVRVENLIPGVTYHLSWCVNPDTNEWRAGDSIPIYGDGEVVEVTRKFGG